MLLVDAGVSHLRFRVLDARQQPREDTLVSSNRDFSDFFTQRRVKERFGTGARASIYITGKLAPMVRKTVGGGKVFMPAGALWLAASETAVANPDAGSLALLEISASGYTVIGVDETGRLKNDLLIANPRCGAGSGINIDRILQKLGLTREQVDPLLSGYIGEAGRQRRGEVTTRADRCGVFSSSATVSDKNQGIPVAVALATTLKSEVLKACNKVPAGFQRATLCGRLFRWEFARNCAEDYLRAIGVKIIDYDTENTRALDAIARLAAEVGDERLVQPDQGLSLDSSPISYPAFRRLRALYTADHRYKREAATSATGGSQGPIGNAPLHLALDVGSTMAKVVLADASGQALRLRAYNNAGDTIETVKKAFTDLRSEGNGALCIRSIGITGSARYQVKEALARIYPSLGGRLNVLVENYAHARGAIDEARAHLVRLKGLGVAGLNEDFCVLIDVGGEDTKISTVALREAELFNNAMNIKCSAGTGSLVDTLAALFGLSGPAEANQLGYDAAQGWMINATCAVFLMENAQKLQAQGVPRAEIIASASWAIVENMARTLWSQIDLPAGSIVLLHGQTMLSEPLPLAVTHRLQSFFRRPSYALVPEHPGHRACLGLIRTALNEAPDGGETICLDDFLRARFEKRLIQCRGAACDDPQAVCNRTSLKCHGSDGSQFSFTLGGCSAVNELFARGKENKFARPTSDPYKELWDFIDTRQPRSDDPRRLVIPRSFAISEWSYFLSQIFIGLGIPVHVDSLRDADLRTGQSLFSIDTCAPHIGAAGQFRRLAGEPHGLILAPQITRICADGVSSGRTCTTNQGGIVVAKGLAETAHPKARFHLLELSLERLDATFLADQLYGRLGPVFSFYRIPIDRPRFGAAVAAALERHRELRCDLSDLAARRIEHALTEQRSVALVVGREYILNPGLYDSHVRRLLRDKGMVAIPSYVLDIDLDERHRDIYWRNPHFIVSVLNAVADKALHQRIRHPRLRELFRQIEAGPGLLPVVQVSTFACGPDSVTAPLVAEVMKRRPFLLIQSDAIIKELAHLENRVNTYVRQLELGLHAKMKLGGTQPFDVRVLDALENHERLDRETDVIYCPTLADNRSITSVMRAAGFTCVDNYRDEPGALGDRVKRGRIITGDAVCAPLAAVYADLQAAVEDFTQRRATESAFKGKRRLLFFDNKGNGPCRQGQYVGVHKLLAYRQLNEAAAPGGSLRLLVGDEAMGYDFGIEEWTLLRLYQATIIQGVLQQLFFETAAECRDQYEYERLQSEYRQLKQEIYQALERFRGPSAFARRCVRLAKGLPALRSLAKYFAYRLHGRDLQGPLRRFARRWRRPATTDHRLDIRLSGEVYMRVAQAEPIFRALLAQLGFRRFRLHVTPVWSYLEYLIEEGVVESAERLYRARAESARAASRSSQTGIRRELAHQHHLKKQRKVLRTILARPLYRAAHIAMPSRVADLMNAARPIVTTFQPTGEFPPLVGEALFELRTHADVFLNIAPRGCMVASMAAAISPRLTAEMPDRGRMEHLFSADGEVDEELLAVALLKSVGPRSYFVMDRRPPCSSASYRPSSSSALWPWPWLRPSATSGIDSRSI